MDTVCRFVDAPGWTDPSGFWTKQSHLAPQPRPTNGMLLAMTVMFSTFADKGSDAM